MSTPLRVAHVVGTTGATGVESHLLALLASFDRAQVEPTLFVPGPGILVDRLRERGVAVEFGAPTRKLALFEAQRLARRWSGAFDVVHAHGPRVAFWTAFAARRAGVPVFVVTQHETRRDSMPPGWKRGLWLRLEAWAQSRADAILPVAEATARELRRQPELARKIRVIHGSAPILLESEKLPRAQPEAMSSSMLRLATIGRFSFEKGYDRLFEALAILARRGIEFQLDVVGHGDLGPELHALASRLDLDRRIRWANGGDALPALLAQSHLYVTASRNEGLSVAGLEAMAIGLPIVGTDVGGMSELVLNGETGVLVPPGTDSETPARLADEIERLHRDPVTAARMGQAAARRARESFGPARMAAEVTDCYVTLLGRTPR